MKLTIENQPGIKTEKKYTDDDLPLVTKNREDYYLIYFNEVRDVYSFVHLNTGVDDTDGFDSLEELFEDGIEAGEVIVNAKLVILP